MRHQRGKQDGRFLKLSHDRKVSPRGVYQASRDRWIPMVPNSFGLPSGFACPGRTPFCESCYAVGSERSQGVLELLLHNARLLTEAGTVDAMAELLEEMVGRFLVEAYRRSLTGSERIFRIHWDGDFFSLDYAAAWARVIHDNPDVTFWAYTRSFRAPVNVVPVLAGIPNFVLYLSADRHNMADARAMAESYPDVRVAVCDVDFASAREIAFRHAVVCPENSGAMPLMEDGRGACVTCQLCPKGRKDVIFSTSHREHADEIVRIAPNIAMAAGECANPGCSNLLVRQAGRGRPRKYCSKECRWKASRAGVKA